MINATLSHFPFCINAPHYFNIFKYATNHKAYFNLFHVNVILQCPVNTLECQMFSDVFREYRYGALAWNGLNESGSTRKFYIKFSGGDNEYGQDFDE